VRLCIKLWRRVGEAALRSLLQHCHEEESVSSGYRIHLDHQLDRLPDARKLGRGGTGKRPDRFRFERFEGPVTAAVTV